ncbi:MAG: FG-GAP-like repeat-containing protein, partial [Planctomycetota bacterium]|nr:FG-GAP-like repeat-containing protein [Planctomycetota bacterium]
MWTDALNFARGSRAERTTRGKNKSLRDNRQRRRRKLLFEALEDRRLLTTGPTIVGTMPSLATSGTLEAGTTAIRIDFSEPVVGADMAGNYQLQGLGPDGLLGTADDLVFWLDAAYSGTQATLNFTNLPADVYRLTVRETITDAAGNPLDGDADGQPGGDWRTEFAAIRPNMGLFASASAATYPTRDYDSPESIAVADFNGDSFNDLVTANSVSDNVAVFRGNGAGGFADAVTYASGGLFPRSVIVGDFNADGKPDLAVANGSSDTVGVLLGNGAGG